MSNKWRVSCDGCILGHYAAKTPVQAVEKAQNRNYLYHPEVLDNPDMVFKATIAGNSDNKVYTVKNMECVD